MTTTDRFWALFNAATCSLNIAMFAVYDNPLNLGVGVFAGLMAIIMVVTP